MSALPAVSDVLAAVAAAFPPAWAEPWDRPGLSCGDASAQVTGVLVTLDPTRAEIARAASLGANLIVSHHPAFIEAPDRVVSGPGPGGVLFDALSAGIALAAAHTNLDRAPDGAAALPALLRLPPGEAIESSMQPVAVVTTFAPTTDAPMVRIAMAAAGAGRIGEYSECAFSAPGTGTYLTPLDGHPYQGLAGMRQSAAEERIEMVCGPSDVAAVVAAARRAVPYEEPLIAVTDARIARGAARMGRISTLDSPTLLGELVSHIAETLRTTPRVWGDRAQPVLRVATATGSAGSLLPDCLRLDADVLIAGEVRYHDALSAMESGLSIIELGHDVSEWPLVPVLGKAVSNTPGLDERLVHIATPLHAWWTP